MDNEEGAFEKNSLGVQANIKPIKIKLEHTDPGKLLLLLSTLNDTTSAAIQVKINNYIQLVTDSIIAFIIQYPRERPEAIVNVIGTKELVPELRISAKTKIIKEPLDKQEPMSYGPGICTDKNLTKEINEILTLKAVKFKNLLTIPIIHPTQYDIVLLVVLVNYLDGIHRKEFCEGCVSECFRFCLGTTLNVMLYEEERRHHERCKDLLLAARKLFINIENADSLFKSIADSACEITKAERALLFLTNDDRDLVSSIVHFGACFDLFTGAVRKVKIPFGEGICGRVVETGLLYNCPDLQKEPYNKSLDEACGFTARNALASPIIFNGQVMGVIMVQNKTNGIIFNLDDEANLTAYCVFLSHGITHGLNYRKMIHGNFRNEFVSILFLDTLRDTKTLEEEFNFVADCPESHEYSRLTELKFIPSSIPDEHTICVCLKFFRKLGFLTKFNIDMKKFINFLLHLKRSYCSVVLHNWTHAFCTFHFICIILNDINFDENPTLTLIEAFAFLIASLGHGIDHRATTSIFQITTGNVYASLYSSPGSMVEMYHVRQLFSLISTPECNITENIETKQFTVLMRLISNMILATDLSSFVNVKPDIEKMINNGYDKKDLSNRSLLHILIMTCAVLNDHAKPWEHCKQWAEHIFTEFYRKDYPSQEEGVYDLATFLSDPLKFAELQIQIMNSISIPAFSFLSKMFYVTTNSYKRVINNREHWDDAIAEINKAAIAQTEDAEEEEFYDY